MPMPYHWFKNKWKTLILAMSTSAPILSAGFPHVIAAGHVEVFQIYVLEWPWHLSSLLNFSINQLNFDHQETCYKDMRSFSRCWLPNEDRQVWLRCEKKLWSENNSTSHWLYLNQQGALVKKIFRNSELLEFCHFERYEWCSVNILIPLFSVLLTCRSCNGGALLFRHWWNQRNIIVVSVRL